jgi:hypothetical protein
MRPGPPPSTPPHPEGNRHRDGDEGGQTLNIQGGPGRTARASADLRRGANAVLTHIPVPTWLVRWIVCPACWTTRRALTRHCPRCNL